MGIIGRNSVGTNADTIPAPITVTNPPIEQKKVLDKGVDKYSCGLGIDHINPVAKADNPIASAVDKLETILYDI